MWNPRSGIRSPSSGIRSPRSGIWSPRSGIWSPSSGIRSPRSGIWSPRSGIRNPKRGMWNPRSGIRNPSSGIRSPSSGIRSPLYIYCIYTLSNFYSSLNLEVQVSTIQNILRMFLIYNGYRTRNFDPGNYQVNFAKQDYLKYSYFIRVDYGTNYPESLKLLTIYILLKINYRFTIRVNLLITPFLEYFNLCIYI
jgi:hypothetical protein